MDINIIKSNERGRTKLPWLDGRHSFSFGSYFNPARMGFGNLIVFNDDIIDAGMGFGTHPHDNAEVVSIAISGALKHEDSMGNKTMINEGEVQRMSAGTGVWHSEFNASSTEKAHFLQIWLEPRELDIKPSYEQKSFADALKKNEFIKIVSGTDDGLVGIHQDAAFYIGDFEKGKGGSLDIEQGKGAYVFVIKGRVLIESRELAEGDSAEITGVNGIKFNVKDDSRVLVIEVNV